MRKKIFLHIAFFLFSVVCVVGLEVEYEDDWDVLHGSSTDGVVWEDEDLAVGPDWVSPIGDCICYDWCDDGIWDTCYCSSSSDQTNCMAANQAFAGVCNKAQHSGQSCIADSSFNLDDFQSIDTSSIGSCEVDIIVAKNCDSSISFDGYNEQTHYVVDTQKYDCDGGSSTEDKEGTPEYDYEGYHGSGGSGWVDIANEVSCPAFRICDENSAHAFHDDQETSSRSGSSLVHPCTLEDGSTSNHQCTSDSQCFSDDCGGAKNEKRNICNGDRGSTFDQEERAWLNTCGGSGYNTGIWGYQGLTGSCSDPTYGGSGYVCDTSHDGSISTGEPPSPCRKDLGESCVVNSDCWNDDSGNFCNSLDICTDGSVGSACNTDSDCVGSSCGIDGLCGGASAPTCDGGVQVIVEDKNNQPIPGLDVYMDGQLTGQTNFAGFVDVSVEDVSCSSEFDFEVFCSSGSSCGTGIGRVRFNNDFDSLEFDCTQCLGIEDLQIDGSKVKLSGNGIEATIDTFGVSGSFTVNFRVQDKDGLVLAGKESSEQVTATSNDDNVIVTESDITLDGDDVFVHVYVDSDEVITEADEENNYALAPLFEPIAQAYLDVDTGLPKVNDEIKDYLRLFVDEVASPFAGAYTICVGRHCSEFDTLNAYTLSSSKDEKFGLVDGKVTYGSDQIAVGSREFNSIVGSFENAGQRYVLAYGSGIAGDLAAVRKIILGKDQFLSETLLGTDTEVTEFIDDQDPTGISVVDILTNEQNVQYYSQNRDSDLFAQAAHDVLFDNNVEIAIKTVEAPDTTSYGLPSILRLKRLNSDLSDNYRDAILQNPYPVVMSHGIFSDLESFQDGLGGELAQEGYEVWTIEMTGGPQLECPTCPDYTYEDIIEEYWPALIGGVSHYSGETVFDYIGHSNGCRTALSSLHEYPTGKSNAGKAFNTVTGFHDIPYEMHDNSIRKFFGMGCPAALNDLSVYTGIARSPALGFLVGLPSGDVAMSLITENHVRKSDYILALGAAARSVVIGGVGLYFSFSKDDNEISRNLMDFYNDLAVDSNSNPDFSNIDVTELLIFTSSADAVVPFNDKFEILNDVTVPTKDFDYSGILHPAMPSSSEIKADIKEELQK